MIETYFGKREVSVLEAYLLPLHLYVEVYLPLIYKGKKNTLQNYFLKLLCKKLKFKIISLIIFHY